MTDEHKPADYAELLSRAEKETHRSGMWADTCLLIDELAAAIRSLIGERDEAHQIAIQANWVRNHAVARAEAAEARLAEYEKALTDTLNALEYHFYKRFPELKSEPVDEASIIGIARAALSRKGEG